MTTLAGLHRLPDELKQRAQWALAGASKAPLSVDANGRLYNTSVRKPSEWLSFDQIMQHGQRMEGLVTSHIDKDGRILTQRGVNAGYILNESDPFSAADLDVKANTPQEELDRYWAMALAFDSYTERSKSGLGLHIWLKGKIGRGFRRDGIEIYSQERFIICTGDVVLDRPIQSQQAMLSNMVTQMRPAPSDYYLEELEEEADDWYILEMAYNAANADKFVPLNAGEWQELGYPSQSEADMALMSMFTFYSQSNAQCRRLFRASGLGKREKATKDDRYLNFTLTTIRRREAQQTLIEMDELLKTQAFAQQYLPAPVLALPPPAPAAAPQPAPVPIAPPTAERERTTDPSETMGTSKPILPQGMPWPPGFAGYLAQSIYRSSKRPVKEVAICLALGMLAGLTGKSWNISGTGLNMYIILVARSGVGKEALHDGAMNLLVACRKDNATIGNYVDFKKYQSGPALVKEYQVRQCAVNIVGEWGRILRKLADDSREGPHSTLRTAMTELYSKSGRKSAMGGLGYSDKEKDTETTEGIAYSFVGETTPGIFYEALTSSMMEDGTMSRYFVIEYDGPRPPNNENPEPEPDHWIVNTLNGIAMAAETRKLKDEVQDVDLSPEAQALHREFDRYCDDQINSTNDESRRQMWNRAALKALRCSGVIAIGQNCHKPVVTAEEYQWSCNDVLESIRRMSIRLSGGDVGSDDSTRERKMTRVIESYMKEPAAKGYKIPDSLRTSGMVPYSYLIQRLGQVAAFSSYKLGINKAVEDTLASMIRSGYLSEAAKDSVVKNHSYHGRVYNVLGLPEYD